MKEKTFYHETHRPKTKRIDTRIPEALKHRKQAELLVLPNNTKSNLRSNTFKFVFDDIIEEDEPC